MTSLQVCGGVSGFSERQSRAGTQRVSYQDRGREPVILERKSPTSHVRAVPSANRPGTRGSSAKEQAGHRFAEGSHRLWQGLLTLTPGRPKVSRPPGARRPSVRTTAGSGDPRRTQSGVNLIFSPRQAPVVARSPDRDTRPTEGLPSPGARRPSVRTTAGSGDHCGEHLRHRFFWGLRRPSRLDPSHPWVLATQPGVAGVEPEGRCPQRVPQRNRPRPLVSRAVGDSEDVHRSGLQTRAEPGDLRSGPRRGRETRAEPIGT